MLSKSSLYTSPKMPSFASVKIQTRIFLTLLGFALEKNQNRSTLSPPPTLPPSLAPSHTSDFSHIVCTPSTSPVLADHPTVSQEVSGGARNLVSTGTLTEPVAEVEPESRSIVKQWKRSTHQQKQLAKKVLYQ